MRIVPASLEKKSVFIQILICRCTEVLIICPKHSAINIVIPRNKPTVSLISQKRSPAQKVINIHLCAHSFHFFQNFQFHRMQGFTFSPVLFHIKVCPRRDIKWNRHRFLSQECLLKWKQLYLVDNLGFLPHYSLIKNTVRVVVLLRQLIQTPICFF